MNGEVKEPEKDREPIILIEDGTPFLSRDELDKYREQKITLAWQEGAYV